MRSLACAAQALLVLMIALHGCALFRARNAGAPQPTQVAEGPHIGEVAPEIEGEDLDGTKFKLSDYRGKVVVLDFWGNW
jgi:cytochrome oxidase Cu insertion factor (SCO1/SenC/PrrC family)